MHFPVYELIEVTGVSSKSMEDAVERAISHTTELVKKPRWFQITEARGSIEKGRVHQWQVTVKVGHDVAE